ncbi:hypothetical protein CAEBREN_26121 [Caenorhabditis brenneri]|uniref:Uncharacterized protein n=1 Tax=Caenorhabditis brenneri TaxID=135651 RepID=G0P6K6_CAEBE|nr:hypothetical protein CAEBREN_26121 [Caenorhabditis brenneri]
MYPHLNESRTFLEFLKWTSVVVVVELTIFFASLLFYHFYIFRKKLSREIERITQKSELLEAEPTQKSENEKPKKKKKVTKKTKTAERKKETKKKETKKKTIRKTNSSNLRLSLENTQMDDYDPEPTTATLPGIPPFNPLLSPPTQESYYDNDYNVQNADNSPLLQKVPSDPDQIRTASLNEKSAYSPRCNRTQEKTLEQMDDADMRTARDDLWY